ncbi:GNAT family N-acetyltransferase [Parvularcula sp. IMCC14364]|uniref:GNAT family N-acetyltransferase n=1 Tax=Parvularcula sp. IMCC14364 TaxID=3067902 RepID=UPI002742110F|nr:GNAT family N-acetyltransferase [Parvularcula sp. IMCC14364]
MTDVIKTARLELRPLTMQDEAAYFAVVNDYDVVKMTASWPWPVSRSYVADRLEQAATRDPSRNAGLGIFANGELAGNMGGHLEAHHVTGEEVIWVGFMLARKWWGAGLMTEALSVLCPYLWRRLGFVDIYGEHYTDNPASGRVMEKAGFTFVGPAQEVWCAAREKHLSGRQYRLAAEGMPS